MGYRYKDVCYETKQQFHEAFAQDCSFHFYTIQSGIYSFGYCTADALQVNYLFKNDSNLNFSTRSFVPQSSTCDYTATQTNKFTNADVVAMSWLIVSVWVAAWAIKKMMEAIKR